jgi:capsular exopolysaccharide synthesis family protein
MIIEHQLLEKFRQIQDEGRTGLLQLEKDSREITIYFRNGFIDGIGSDVAHLQLDKVILKRGSLPLSAISKLVKNARGKGMQLGKAAVSNGLLDECELKESIQDQIIQAVNYALSHEFRIRDFRDNLVDLYMPAELDLEQVVLELARTNVRPIQLDPNAMLCLLNGRSLSHLPWYPQELSVLNQLKTPCTPKDLATATGLEYGRLCRILSVFDALRLISPAEAVPSDSTAIVKREGFPFEYLTPEIGISGLSRKLEAFHNPTSFISEQFKTLKVRLAEASRQAPLQVIAISSPNTEDGKSLISANLALSLSRDSGRRVAIVDCDLRNPSFHKYLGISVEPGLLGYLEGNNLRPYCYLRRLEKLYLMTAGGVSLNPIELLSDTRMHELVAYLKTEFDTIILDCPPFGPISDAKILTGLADGFLMVLRCGKTNYGSISKACDSMDRSKLVGLIFNDVKPMMFNTKYHYQYYRYGNRSHYPYGSKKIVSRPKNYLE